MEAKTRQPLRWYHKFCINILKAGPIPRHIAIIMDGNRRYAKTENVPTATGHRKGFDVLNNTIFWCQELGISELTVYAFSIENFKRNAEEVGAIMKLTMHQLEKMLETIEGKHENGLCVRLIGNWALMPVELRARSAKLMLQTKDNDKCFLNVAFAYTSQDEITNAFQEINNGVRAGQLKVDDINEHLISQCMYSRKSPTPDILIRTSGEIRLSDFLLWQSWNTNIMFHDVLWPQFSIWPLMYCVFYYQRHRADQKRIEEQIGEKQGDVREKNVEEYLLQLENRWMIQLELYAQQEASK